jgi:hypothetical protein
MGEMRGYKKRGIPRPFDCYTYYIYIRFWEYGKEEKEVKRCRNKESPKMNKAR